MSNQRIPTKAELKAHLDDRANDLPRAEKDFTPPWVEDREDKTWKHIRERERRVSMLTTRLDKAKTKLDQNWDDKAYEIDP